MFLVLLGLLCLRGFLRGFSGEFFSIASLALGITGAVCFLRPGAAFLRARYFGNLALLPEIAAFFSIFLVVFIAGKILERIVKDIIERLKLDKLDRALGLLFGLAEAFALIALVILVIAVQPLFDAGPLLGESLFARLILPLVEGRLV